MIVRSLSIVVGIMTFWSCASPMWAADTTGPPPNFIIIFVDDIGYQDVGCYGAEKIKTRRVDRMASEGIRFTDFYVAAPICSPSRAEVADL